MHSQVSLLTYTDFGQNRGRYSVGNVNALLQHIREVEGGVRINYQDGRAPYTMQHGMIDFAAQCDGGFSAIIGYNFDATVKHNGINNNTYTGNHIGRENAIHYKAIEIIDNGTFSDVFAYVPSNDYRVTRQSKLATDVYGTSVYGQNSREDWDDLRGNLTGSLIYRAGSGNMQVADLDGSVTGLAMAYTFITGGISSITDMYEFKTEGGCKVFFPFNAASSGISASAPLPDKPLKGDSGSPVYIWNDKTERYEYLGAFQSIPTNGSNATTSVRWSVEKMEGLNRIINSDTSTFYINGLSIEGETIADNLNHSTTIRKGVVQDADGKQIADYIGCNHTWKNLSDVKDNAHWYAYGNEYLSASVEDLFFTQNLVFVAQHEQNAIVLNDDIDLGVGYVQLSKAEGLSKASFTVTSAGNADNTLRSAGYVVDSGVELHLQIADNGQMSEWRKVGEGDLYIEGKGDTNILLNVGGGGKNFLNREDGYAAYNVLVNSGATVLISDINQIKRDLTFGFRGGVLDMNGNSMVWNNDNKADAQGFTIHALDDQAVIANLKAGSTTTLTWKQGGTQTWLGSFRDSAESALKFVYDGGGLLTMNGIHTSLQHADSGMEVASGKVVLTGTNTVHGDGSLNGFSAARYNNSEDWHYADASMNVGIASGAIFELSSHARLIGNVSVAEGGTFIMREGTQHRYEYIEGGQVKEDTQKIADFFGLKGDIVNDGSMVVEYGTGSDSRNVYSGNISGSGSLGVTLGLNAKLEFSGAVDLGGAKTLTSGMLILTHAQVGGGEKWQVGQQAVLAFTKADAAAALDMISGSSSGVLAIGKDTMQQLDMSGHGNLFLGAAEACTTAYGVFGTTETLAAWHQEGDRTQWLLGGGEGHLIVHWRLTGESDLILGNTHGVGTVTLTNMANDFTGNIVFTPGSNVVLDYTDVRALGNAKLNLGYGMALSGGKEVNAMVNSEVINPDAAGIVLLDQEAGAVVDMSSRPKLALGVGGEQVVFTGSISVGEDQAYRFSGPGRLLLMKTLEAKGTNDLIVDAQGFTGGSVSLMTAGELTGNVLVEGYDDTQSDIRSGGISLILGADKALDSASRVSVQQGGTLVAASGTSQHIKTLELRNGGFVELQDNAALEVDALNIDTGATLSGADAHRSSLTVGSGRIEGNVAVTAICKTGAGDLVLGNDVWGGIAFDTLNINEGSVSLTKNLGGSGGTIVLAQDTAISLGGHTLHNAVLARGNATIFADGGTLVQNLDVAEGVILSVQGKDVYLTNGEEDKDKNITNLQTMQLAISGGTVDFSAVGTLHIDAWQDNAATLIGNGKLILPQEMRISTRNGYTAALCFDRLETSGDSSISQEGAANANVRIETKTLAGSGTLTWKAGADSTQASAMVISEAIDMEGVLTVQQNGNITKGNYQTYLELAGKDFVSQATVNLQGGKGYASLALNADHAKLAGLQGNAKSLVFAGGTPESVGNAPASTRNVKLEITGNGQYNFGGDIVGSADKAVSVIMSGSGQQVFSGTDINLRDVTVQSGTLRFDKNPQVYGNYSIAQGAVLDMRAGLTLRSGQILSATAGADGQSATLKASLFLEGGSLSFSGNALNSLTNGSSLLHISSVSSNQNSVNIIITDSAELTMGRTYYLAAGDFSILDPKFSYNFEHKYFQAGFKADKNGLRMTLTAKDGSLIWNGAGNNDTWDKDVFGQQADVDFTGKSLIFTDMAENKDVRVNHTMNVGIVTVDTEKIYSFSPSDQNEMTAAQLNKRGSGTLVLSGGLRINGITHLEKGTIVISNGSYVQGTIDGENGTLALENAGDTTLVAKGTIGDLEIRSGTRLMMFEDAPNSPYDLSISGQVHVKTGGIIALEAGLDVNSKISLEGGMLTLDDPSYPGEVIPGQLRGTLSVCEDSTIEVAQARGQLTLNKVASADGTTLTKKGAGLLVFTGNEFDIRCLDLAEGSVKFSGPQKLVTGVDTIVVREQRTLNVDSGLTLITDLKLEKGSTLIMLQNDDLNTTLSTEATMEGDVTIDFERYGSGSTTLNGNISGSGTLTLRQTHTNETGVASQVTFGVSLKDGEEGKVTSLHVSGGAAVTISKESIYSGGTVIDGNSSVTVTNILGLGRGSVEIDSGSTLTLSSDVQVSQGITGGGTVVSAASTNELRIVTMEDKICTFHGDISGEKLSLIISGTGTQIIGGSVEVGSVSARGGRLELSQDGSVQTGGIYMTSSGDKVNGALENLSLRDGAITGEGETRGELQALAIVLGAGETTLTHLRIAADTRISGMPSAVFSADSDSLPATVVLDGSVVKLEAGVNAKIIESTDTLCRIECSTFSDVTLSGDLVLDFSSILDAEAKGSVVLQFSDTVSLPDDLTIGGLWNGYTLPGSISGDTLTFALIPEPSAATLSLLALAALVTRRRRPRGATRRGLR